MTEKRAAKLVGFSPRTLQKWRIEGRGPRFVKCGRSVRYRWQDLQEWMQENLRRSTSDPGGSEED
jgi:excisionase family DNA binding protein